MGEATNTLDVDISKVGALGNQFIADVGKLRDVDPVRWSPSSGCWLITRHDDVADALSGKLPLSTKRLISIGLGAIPEAERAERFPAIMRYMPNWIVDVDPPDHTRLRKLMVKAFSKKVVESVRPFVRERVKVLLEKLSRQPEIEFNEEISRQLPGSVILKLIGLSWCEAIVPMLAKAGSSTNQ